MCAWNSWHSRRIRLLTVAVAMVVAYIGEVFAVTDAETLRGKYTEMAPQLRASALGRPLVLQSTQQVDQLRSEIYAVLPYSHAQLRNALQSPVHWCDMLMLNIKTIGCQLQMRSAGARLLLHVGRTGSEDLAQALPLEFSYRVQLADAHYLDMALQADSGPSGTSDYRFRIEAIGLPDGQSFVRLTYAYASNAMARLATQAYLATLGRDKVGFTPDPDAPATRDGFIGGPRGLVERNAMRYFLAIDAYLQVPGPGTDVAVRAQRLQHWFDAAEGFARQLHEVDRAAYLEMKQAQWRRRQPMPD